MMARGEIRGREVIIPDLVHRLPGKGQRRGDTGREELHLEKAARIQWEFGGKGEKMVEREKARELNVCMPGALIPGKATF